MERDNLDMKEFLEHKYGTYEEAKKEREELKQMRIAQIKEEIDLMHETLKKHEEIINDSTRGYIPDILRRHYASVTKMIHKDLQFFRSMLFMERMNLEYDFKL